MSQLSSLPSGAARRLGNLSVQADAPYHAASGRTCRALHLKPAQSKQEIRRVACTDGKTWFFVPDVFGNNPAE
jgi:hypothetical protein